MKGLYICSFDPESNSNSYFNEWAENFRMQNFEIFNSYLQDPFYLKKLINPFCYDIIIFGYSFLSNLHGRAKHFLRLFTKFSKATIIGFMQNEFRNLPTLVKEYESLNVDIIVSQFNQDLANEIYGGRTKAKIISLPHAMSSIKKINHINHNERSVDIGGRLRSYAYYFGNHQREQIIPDFIKKVKRNQRLKLDFSFDEKDRFNYNEWMNFLKNCRMSLSCESGSFFLQWTDSLRKKFIKIEKEQPTISFKEFYKNFLKNSKSHFNASIISSRQFDAIAAGSCNLLVEGEYSGLLDPDIHYIKIKNDLSNFDEIIEMVSDYKFTEKISKKALEHCLQYHTIKKRIKSLLKNI